MQYEIPFNFFFISCYFQICPTTDNWRNTWIFHQVYNKLTIFKLNLRLATNFMLFLVWQWCFSIRDKYKNERNISIHYVGYSDYKLVLLGDFDGGTVLKNSYLQKKNYVTSNYHRMGDLNFLKKKLIYFRIEKKLDNNSLKLILIFKIKLPQSHVLYINYFLSWNYDFKKLFCVKQIPQ